MYNILYASAYLKVLMDSPIPNNILYNIAINKVQFKFCDHLMNQ